MHAELINHRVLNTRIVFLSLCFLVLYAVVYFIWGEKLSVAGGLGWDGVTYAAYATNFLHEITTTSDVYHVNRILPSFVIYCIAKISGITLASPHAVFVAFYILNNLMFLGAGYLWYKVCRLKEFNTFIYLIGFISLFVNYASLKLSQYAPVFVDPTVLFLGMIVLYLYLKRNYISICFLLFPVFFTWPIAVVLVLPLIIYIFSDSDILKDSPQRKMNAVLIVVLFVGYVSAVLFVLIKHTHLVSNWVSVIGSWNQAWWPPNSRRFFWIYLVVPLSIVITSVYIYFIAFNSMFFRVIKNSYRVYWPHVALYVLFIVACAGLFYWLAHLSFNYTGKTIFSSSEFLALTVLGSIAKPAFNLVMHTTFLGAGAVLCLFYMRSLMTAANEETFGLLVFVIITYFMALNCHSRQLIFNMPFMIYLLCSVLDNLKKFKNKTRFLGAYALAALIGSKLYYFINVAPLQGDILHYPFQRFFMNFGLWTTWSGYLFNLIVMIVMCLFLYMGFYKNNEILDTKRPNAKHREI